MAAGLDDTQELLDLADEEDYPLAPVQDSSEDEVFIGTPRSKEKKGNRRSRRETLDQAEVGDFRRASQLDRSSLSLLSSDNTIHEEEEGEEVLQDCEVSSSCLGDLATVTEDKVQEAEDEEEETEDKEQETEDNNQELEDKIETRDISIVRDRGSSEDWETESETSVLDPSLSDATEMEVSIEISGIARLPASRPPSLSSASTTRSGLYDSFSDDTEEVLVEETEGEEEVVFGGSRGVEDEEEEYLKDLQYIAKSEADGDTEEESEEDEAEVLEEEQIEEENVDKMEKSVEEQEEQQEEESRSRPSPPRVHVTRPSCGHDTSSFYYSANSSPRVSQVAQTSAEPTFDTTIDEMILYEMYGDDYDDKVEAMTAEERLRLQDEVNGIKQKESERQLRQRLQERLGSATSLPDSVCSAVSPFSLGADTPSPAPSPAPSSFSHTPSAFALSPSSFSPTSSCQLSDPNLVTMEEERPAHHEGKVTPPRRHDHEFLVPKSQDRLATYSAPTLASLHRRASPSPKKTPSHRPAWIGASPIPGKELSLSPMKAVPRVKPPSRLPMPVTRHLASTPGHLASPMTRPMASPALLALRQDFRAIQSQVSSPVANYVKSNPAPPLVRNVVAKETARDLESTLMEVDQEDQENQAPLASCPLPANTYRPAARRQETRLEGTPGQQYQYIPEAYGQAYSGAEASVTKHLSRRKVQDQASPLPSSRNSSLEMSVLETKVVRTFATPLPRTANH